MSAVLMQKIKTLIVTGEDAKKEHPHAVRVVTRIYDDGSAWRTCLVLDRKAVVRDISKSRKEYPNYRARALSFVEPTGPGWHEHYSGPGLAYARRPYRLRWVSKRWIVWVQSGGVDV